MWRWLLRQRTCFALCISPRNDDHLSQLLVKIFLAVYWADIKFELFYIWPLRVTWSLGIATWLLQSAHWLMMFVVCAKLFKKTTTFQQFNSNGADTICDFLYLIFKSKCCLDPGVAKLCTAHRHIMLIIYSQVIIKCFQ